MNQFVHSMSRIAAALLLLAAAHQSAAQAPSIATPGFGSNGRLDLVVPASGLPFVAFQDGPAIKAMACADSACTAAASVSTLATLTASRIRVAIGSDGLPVVSISIVNNGLRFVKCQNAACSLATTAILESVNLGNTDHALAIPPDGRPLIAYLDANNQDLLYVRCGDGACADANKFAAIDTTGTSLRAPSIALVGGLPQMAYQNAGLRLATCASLDCSDGISFKTLSPEPPISTAVLAGRDGAALIAYEADAAVDSLRLAKCSDVACTVVSVLTLDKATSVGVGTGVQMRQGADGLPVISYFDRQFGTVKLARCSKQDCSASTLTTVHAPATNVLANGNTQAALAISAHGTPLLAYAQQLLPAGLTIHSCNTRSCQ